MANIKTQLQVIVNDRWLQKINHRGDDDEEEEDPRRVAAVAAVVKAAEAIQVAKFNARLPNKLRPIADVLLGESRGADLKFIMQVIATDAATNKRMKREEVRSLLRFGVNSGFFVKNNGVYTIKAKSDKKVLNLRPDGVILLNGLPSDTAPPWLNYKQASRGIRLSISEKAGELGMCSGIITSGFLAKDVINNDDFIIVAYSRIQPRRNYYWRFSGFATCNFKYDWRGKKTLYINVLCANVPGVAQKIMKMVICKIGKYLSYSSPGAPLISAIQLSSLTYVIGYYYKKWGFRFYKDDDIGTYDAKVNTAAKELPRIGPEIEGMADFAEIESWEEAVEMKIPGIAKPLTELRRLEKLKARRETLPARLDAVDRINNAWRVALTAVHRVQAWMNPCEVPANPSPYSVCLPNYRVQDRAVDAAVIFQRHDPGGEGWTMLLPKKKWNITRGAWVDGDAAMAADEYAPSIATVCAAMGMGGGRKKRRKSKRRKKGTKKRALKKRHRRRTKRPKRRRRTRRRRRRRRRRTRR